ncbi:MAG TPA: FxsA family protein [Pirellulaceae bacterium]|nr:FxsA family protein [Pirellulaceae bacterium]
MFTKLLLLLVLVPLADLVLLLMISQYLGFWGTVALVILTGLLGVGLFRWQLRALARAADPLGERSQVASHLLSDGLMIFVGAALLVTPGLITDIIGISLLIPTSRRWHQRRLLAWLLGHGGVVTIFTSFPRDDESTVEGHVVDRKTDSDAP